MPPSYEEIVAAIEKHGEIKVKLYDGYVFYLIGVGSSQERFVGKIRKCEGASEYSVYYNEVKEILDAKPEERV